MTVFGDLLRDHRLRAARTQEELAEQAGLSVRALGKLESGETVRPRPVTVRLLAGALELPEPELAAFTAAAFGIDSAGGGRSRWHADGWRPEATAS
ncbi:helix-turn-helix domain-containing protein [Pseudonocardia sichuanensis]